MKPVWLILTAFLLVGCGATPILPDMAGPEVTDTVPASEPSPSAARSSSPSTSVAPRPQCGESGVEVTVGEVNGAMGLRAVGITLRNCGTRRFTVNGYPVIDVLDADRKKLDVSVLNGTEHVSLIERYAGPPRRINIAPGGSVGAVLVWRNVTTDTETAAKGAYLRVAPASGQPAHTLALAVDPGNTGKLAVSPWTSPPTGSG